MLGVEEREWVRRDRDVNAEVKTDKTMSMERCKSVPESFALGGSAWFTGPSVWSCLYGLWCLLRGHRKSPAPWAFSRERDPFNKA